MKLYLSSYRIPTPDDLADLIGKPLRGVTVALIPNAKDQYIQRVKDIKVGYMVSYMQDLGMDAAVVDLQEYDNAQALQEALSGYDLIWVMGGNTYMLRYEMRRSGFDTIIRPLLEKGAVYGGDSAGALAACESIAGVESADNPDFAEELVKDGLGLVPYMVLPHVDNPEFSPMLPLFRQAHEGKEIIELKDSQAVIFDGDNHRVVTGEQGAA
jgi:dipeptidase E